MYPELISRVKPLRTPLVGPFTLLSTLLVALLAPSQAVAEWNGGVSGGAVIRDGVQSNRLRLSLTNDIRPLSHHIYADWIFGGGDDAYELGYRPRYWFNEDLYAFGELNIRIDEQVGIDQETGQTLGVGYQLLRNNTQSASIELSGGARQISFTNPAIEDSSDPFGRARFSFNQLLGESARFQFDASSSVSDIITESVAEAGVTVKVGTVALTLGYRVINQQIDGQDSVTDDTTTFSFNYAI